MHAKQTVHPLGKPAETLAKSPDIESLTKTEAHPYFVPDFGIGPHAQIRTVFEAQSHGQQPHGTGIGTASSLADWTTPAVPFGRSNPVVDHPKDETA